MKHSFYEFLSEKFVKKCHVYCRSKANYHADTIIQKYPVADVVSTEIPLKKPLHTMMRVRGPFIKYDLNR